MIRESNPRPPAPEAGIIPLDQSPATNVRTAFVAQWIEHQTSNLGVAGSSPAEGTNFYSERGCSSDGRARALHARGTGIDTLLLQLLFFLFPFVFGVVLPFLASISKKSTSFTYTRHRDHPNFPPIFFDFFSLRCGAPFLASIC